MEAMNGEGSMGGNYHEIEAAREEISFTTRFCQSWSIFRLNEGGGVLKFASAIAVNHSL